MQMENNCILQFTIFLIVENVLPTVLPFSLYSPEYNSGSYDTYQKIYQKAKIYRSNIFFDPEAKTVVKSTGKYVLEKKTLVANNWVFDLPI